MLNNFPEYFCSELQVLQVNDSLWISYDSWMSSWKLPVFFFLITTLSWKRKCLLRSTPGWNRVWWPMTEISSRTKQLCAIGFLNLFRVFSEELETNAKVLANDSGGSERAHDAFLIQRWLDFFPGQDLIERRVADADKLFTVERTKQNQECLKWRRYTTAALILLYFSIRNTLKAGGEETALADSQWFHLQHELF